MDWAQTYKWRPVMAQKATLEEIDRHWSMVDLAIAHQLLDVNEEADEHNIVQQRREMENASRK